MIKEIPLESGDIVIVNWNVIGHVAGWIDTLYKVRQKSKQIHGSGFGVAHFRKINMFTRF